MEVNIQQISEDFSKGNFTSVYPYLSENIQWNVVGAPLISGKENVIDNCTKMQVEMAGARMKNTHFIIGYNSTMVQGHCLYTNPDNTPGKVEYCNVYRFSDDKLLEITSYCIEIKLNEG